MRNYAPTTQQSPCYVYLLACANGTLYVGSTHDVERRVAQHNAGRGGGYTRINRPVSLLAMWPFNNRREARKAERVLKRLPPDRKLMMIPVDTLEG